MTILTVIKNLFFTKLNAQNESMRLNNGMFSARLAIRLPRINCMRDIQHTTWKFKNINV